MASFIEGLDPETRRGMAQSLIQGGISREMGANEIQRMLQEVDLGYRRTVLLSDVRQWKDAFLQGERMKYTTMAGKFSEDRYVATEWRQTSVYETKFRALMRDPITGETRDRFVTVRHQHEENGIMVDDLSQTKTREELQEVADQYFRHSTWKDEEMIGSSMPMTGLYNPNLL